MAAALDLRDELDALTKSLDAANVPYAVCGALARAIHGHPRATKAIDLVVDPDMSPASIERRLREVSRVSPLTSSHCRA